MFQKGGSSRSNRLRLLPFDKVEHALRRALLRYVQIAQLATHARDLHALQCTRGFVIPQTTGFGFSKRWVSFHKTTRIFDGFEQGLFNGCSMVVQWLFNDCSMVGEWLSPCVVSSVFCFEHECDSFSSETRKRFCLE